MPAGERNSAGSASSAQVAPRAGPNFSRWLVSPNAHGIASFDGIVRAGRPVGSGYDAVEFVEQIRLAKRLIEFGQPGANPAEVESVVNFQNALDVGDVAGSPGDRLHDHNRLRGRERQADAGDLHAPGATDDLVFQRQSAEHDVNRDSAWLVQDKQNAACIGEIEGIVDAGDEPELPSRLQERSPFVAVENHEDVDVLGEPRPP